MMKKRIVALILTVLMLLQCMPMSALADEIVILSGSVGGNDTYYSVVFNDFNGTEIVSQQVVPNSQEIVVPEDPHRKGYTFVGWDIDTTDAKISGLVLPVTGDQVYTAAYAEIDRYTVTINYVLENGTAIATPAVRSYLKSETSVTESVSSPGNVVIFDEDKKQIQVFPDQPSVEIVVANLPTLDEADGTVDNSVSFSVTYKEANVPYAVEHWFEISEAAAEGDVVMEGITYRKLKTESDRKGYVGQTVIAESLDMNSEANVELCKGYTYIATMAETAVINADSTTENAVAVKAYYGKNINVLQFDTMGGAPINSVFKKFGEQVTLPVSTVVNEGDVLVERIGYTFAGWYRKCEPITEEVTNPTTDETTTVITGYNYSEPIDASTTTIPMPREASTTIYAKWDAKLVDFKINFFCETTGSNNLADSKPEKANQYNLRKQETFQALADSTLTEEAFRKLIPAQMNAQVGVGATGATWNSPVANLVLNDANRGYTKIDFANTPIRADGLTEFNVYYDLITFEVRFYGNENEGFSFGSGGTTPDYIGKGEFTAAEGSVAGLTPMYTMRAKVGGPYCKDGKKASHPDQNSATFYEKKNDVWTLSYHTSWSGYHTGLKKPYYNSGNNPPKEHIDAPIISSTLPATALPLFEENIQNNVVMRKLNVGVVYWSNSLRYIYRIPGEERYGTYADPAIPKIANWDTKASGYDIPSTGPWVEDSTAGSGDRNKPSQAALEELWSLHQADLINAGITYEQATNRENWWLDGKNLDYLRGAGRLVNGGGAGYIALNYEPAMVYKRVWKNTTTNQTCTTTGLKWEDAKIKAVEKTGGTGSVTLTNAYGDSVFFGLRKQFKLSFNLGLAKNLTAKDDEGNNYKAYEQYVQNNKNKNGESITFDTTGSYVKDDVYWQQQIQKFAPAKPAVGDKMKLAGVTYTFKGWEAANGSLLNFNSTVRMPAAESVYTAVWEAETVNITLDLNYEGENVPEPVSFDAAIQEKVSERKEYKQGFANHVRDGYEFKGWYSDEKLEEPYDVNSPITGPAYLRAKWQGMPVVYTVKYVDKNGKELAASKQVSDYRVGDEVTEKPIEINGYRPNVAEVVITLVHVSGHEIEFIYTEDVDVPYTVYYGYWEEAEEDSSDEPKFVELAEHKESIAKAGVDRVIEIAEQISGYYPDANAKHLMISANAEENKLYFLYTPYEKVDVTINHWYQNYDTTDGSKENDDKLYGLALREDRKLSVGYSMMAQRKANIVENYKYVAKIGDFLIVGKKNTPVVLDLFYDQEFTIAYVAKEGGSVSPESEKVVWGGTAVGSTATADGVHFFLNWTDKDGKVVSTDETWAPTGVKADATYYANFEDRYQITLTVKDTSATYKKETLYGLDVPDALTGDTDTCTISNLPDGYTLTGIVYTPSSGVNAVEEENAYNNGSFAGSEFKVLDGNKNDVTHMFLVNGEPGKLVIAPAKVTITVENAEKAFETEDPTFTGTVTGLLKNDTLGEVVYFRTNKGDPETEKVGEYLEVLDATYEENSNYTVEVNKGNFKIVTADPWKDAGAKLTANDAEKVYDGTPICVSAEVTSNENKPFSIMYRIDGENEWTDVPPSRTDKGETKVYVKAVRDGYNELLMENPVILKVIPRPITITAASAQKDYNGEALTNSGWAVTEDYGKLIEELDWSSEAEELESTGDAVTLVTVTGSQTLVGKSDNIPSNAKIMRGNEDVTSNYTITYKEGVLIVVRGKEYTPTTKSHENKKYALGETVTFSIEVTNIYDEVQTITLEELSSVTLAKSVFEDVQPGASIETTATYVVTEADILEGKFHNVVTAKFSNGDTPPPGTDDVDPDDPKGHLTITKTTTSTPENGETYALGEEIAYEITVTNDGNVTISDIVVTDELTGDTWTIGSLIPGASETVTATYTVIEADILAGKVVNEATATGKDPNGKEPEVDPGKKEDPTEDPKGHLTITKTTTSTPENGETYALGEEIAYEITVTNDGNVTISDIEVTDELTGDTWSIASLAPGASETVTATYTVIEVDILAGKVVNEATATGKDPNGEDPEVDPGKKEDPTEDPKGHLTITKTTTSTPENGETYALGEEIAYEITVANDGNVTISDIEMTDELTGDTWTIASLAPGASETVTATYTVIEADILAGKVVNEATATGKDPNGEDPEVDPGKKEDPTEDPKGHLTITKTTTSTPENGKTYALGEEIAYEITVTNDGNVTISDIEVTDELTGDTWTIASLAPDASETVTATYTVIEADILAGKVVNVATATGKDPNGKEPEVDPGEKEDPTEDPKGHLTITKITTSTPENGETYALGEEIAYEITVTNDGNVTISDIVVTDELTGDTWTIASLAPGAEQVYEPTYRVTEADVLAGKVVNEATATGKDPNGEDPEVVPGEKEDPTEEPEGHLTITKTTTSTPSNSAGYKAGETIVYKITVVNDGNLTIKDIVVTDELTGNTGDAACKIATLAPGAMVSFTTEYVVTEADVAVGEVVNVATATGSSPDPDQPDVPVVPGTKVDDTCPRYNLTVRYWYNAVGGEVAARTFQRSYYLDDSYRVVSPRIPGHAISTAVVSGVIAGDVEYDVIYTPIDYNFRVRYIYEDGTTAAKDFTATLRYGESYHVTSPAIAGYVPSIQVVKGKMGERDLVFTVIYVPESVAVIINENGLPLGLGNVEMNVGDCFE